MSHLYLITHAHTRIELEVDATQWILSEEGREQAQILARHPLWASVDHIFLSSEPKAKLTVEPVLSARDLSITVDARFDELHRRPQWVEDYVARVADVFAQPHRSVGGWEPAADALDRFLRALRTLTGQAAGRTLALVGHGLTFSLYRAHLLGHERVDLEDWRNLSFAAMAKVDMAREVLISDFHPVAGNAPRG